jgi:glycosyltransferase involved in cell wall biosynthesis
VRALARGGHAPEVITSTDGETSIDGIRVRRLNVARMPVVDVAISPSLVAQIRDELRDGDFDVVHAHVSVISPTAYSAVLAARGLGLPTVVTFHSLLLNATHVLRAIDRLIGWSEWPMTLTAVSRLVASQVRRAAAVDVTVLPNGVDLDLWRVRHVPREPADVRVVSTMRLNRKKRPFALLRAFHAASDEAAVHGLHLHLQIAGDGPERPRLMQYIRRHHLDDRVELLGAVNHEELPKLYAHADMFVMSSRRESFGIAALEARCAGLPVIAMRGSGVEDFLRHDETALLAGDDESLKDCILRLTFDESLRTRLSPPDAALSRFAWPEVVAAHISVYNAAQSGRHPEGASATEGSLSRRDGSAPIADRSVDADAVRAESTT